MSRTWIKQENSCTWALAMQNSNNFLFCLSCSIIYYFKNLSSIIKLIHWQRVYVIMLLLPVKRGEVIHHRLKTLLRCNSVFISVPDWGNVRARSSSPVRRLWTLCRKRSLCSQCSVSCGSHPHTLSRTQTLTQNLIPIQSPPGPCPPMGSVSDEASQWTCLFANIR